MSVALPVHAPVSDGVEQAAASMAMARTDGARCHMLDTSAWQLGRDLDDVAALDVSVVDAGDFVAALRPAVRAGDVIVMVADSSHPVPSELRWRAQAWGAVVIWLGWGHRPAPGSADHVLWAEPMTGIPVRTWVTDTLRSLGTAIAAQPVVVGPRDPDPGEVCITCADEGIVMEVVGDDSTSTVVARSPDGRHVVDVTLVGTVEMNDILLVHAGMAITQIDMIGQTS